MDVYTGYSLAVDREDIDPTGGTASKSVPGTSQAFAVPTSLTAGWPFYAQPVTGRRIIRVTLNGVILWGYSKLAAPVDIEGVAYDVYAPGTVDDPTFAEAGDAIIVEWVGG